MTKSQYAQQLKSPEWKAKRLSILNRDNHKCTKCGSIKGLHVHHLSYTQGCNAWEYPDDNLITLCRSCHKDIHDLSKDADSENFYFIFLESLAPSFKLSYGELRLMNALNFKAVYNTGTFVLSMKQREELCETLGIKKQSLSNSLNSLKRKKLLAYDRGEWTINPTYFWKGSLKDRSAKLKDMSLKMTFEISHDFETCEDND